MMRLAVGHIFTLCEFTNPKWLAPNFLSADTDLHEEESTG